MKRLLVLSLAASTLAACAAMPTTAPAGVFETDAAFSVNLPSDWSHWPAQANFTTSGEYLTKDGVLLNRLHFLTIEDGGTIVRAMRNADVPTYDASAGEFEVIEFITQSLEAIGYNSVEAAEIRPAEIDGVEGLRFEVSGNWENGLNVRGDIAAVAQEDALSVIIFMAPEMHYYGALQGEVDTIISSMDLAAG